MSIVLDALEKVQREGRRIAPLPVERALKDVREPGLQKKTGPRRKIFIFGPILVIAVINLFFLGWWLNQNNSTIALDIHTVSKTHLPKVAHAHPPGTPPLDVTGIVWDQKEPIALVNGKFLKVGDEILGARIIDIQLKEIRFLYKEKEFTISVE